MRVLGIDPGTKCGWAVLDQGRRIASGVWDLSPKRHEGGGMRFLRLRTYLSDLAESQIDAVAYEEVRRHMGVDAAHVYGGIVGVLTSWCESHKTPYRGIPVGTIKKHATGKGNASKTEMVAAALGRFELDSQSHDEADALFCASVLDEELGAVDA